MEKRTYGALKRIIEELTEIILEEEIKMEND